MSEPNEWLERIDQAIQEYPELGEYLEAIRGNIEALAERLKAVPVKSCKHCASLGATETQAAWPCATVKAARGE